MMHLVYHFLLLMYYNTMVNSGLCPLPKETVSYVASCPTTHQEWRQRAQIKNCLCVFQQCSDPHKYVYHCVINSYVNATLEVCAPGQYIIGQHCVEFNILGGLIQENQYASCAPFCPFSYNSTDAFKYQECYEKTRLVDDIYEVGNNCSTCVCPNNTGSTGFNFSTNRNENETTDTREPCLTWLTLFILNSCIVVICVVIILVQVRSRYQLCHLWCKRNIPDDKDDKTSGDKLIEDNIYTTIPDEEMQETVLTQGLREPNRDLNASDESNGILKDSLNRDEETVSKSKTQREAASQLKTDTIVIAIDIGEKFWGFAYSHPEKPGRVVQLDPISMEKISFLIKDQSEICEIGKEATEKYMNAEEDLENYMYIDKITLESDTVNGTQVKSIDIFKKWADKSIRILFFEIDKKFGTKEKTKANKYRTEYVISADHHWTKKREIMRDAICEIQLRHMTEQTTHGTIEKSDIFFINKVQTIKYFMHGVKPDATCLNFDVDNLRVDKSTTYAVLNVGFGSCHLTLLQGHDSQKALDDIIEKTGRLEWDTENAQCSPGSGLMDLFRNIFGIDFFNKWISDNPRQKFLLMSEFEKNIKKIIRCDDSDDDMTFEFKLSKGILDSHSLGILHVRKSMEDEYKNEKTGRLEMEMKVGEHDLFFKCSWNLLKRCFKNMKTSVDDVIKERKEWFEQHNVQSVFIIGGYNTMKLIQDASKNEWFIGKTVTIPTDAGLCYAMGAAFAGLTKDLDLSYKQRNGI